MPTEAMSEPAPRMRQWTDRSNTVSLMAAFQGVVADKVKLKKGDGVELLMPRDMLSADDEAWIAERSSEWS